MNVIGSNKAMASAGPIPGNTPTSVPRNVPRSPNKIFIGVIADAKPFNIELVNEIDETDRGSNGFGSTGTGI